MLKLAGLMLVGYLFSHSAVQRAYNTITSTKSEWSICLWQQYWKKICPSLFSYIRAIPFKNDVEHQSAFLLGETWDDYLIRMKRSRELGDHIVLRALVDVYSLQVIGFKIFQEDIRRTQMIVESDAHNDERLTVSLNHYGEFHYLSLNNGHIVRNFS